MSSQNKWVIFDGRVIPADKPVVGVSSRGLMYGDGIFETLRTYQAQTFLFQEHIKRLHSGMEVLGIQQVAELTRDSLRTLIIKLLEKNGLVQDDAIIRIQVWRDGSRGYYPKKNCDTHFSITASGCPTTFHPPSLATVERRRIPSESLPTTGKFTNGINYILAAREADQQGADDALMQTVDGFVSETTIANLFWLKDNVIYTPDEHCDLIPGLTRNTLIEIIRDSERWMLKKGQFALSDLLEAEAVWMSNSVREILPVASIDGNSLPTSQPDIAKLQELFVAFRNANLIAMENYPR